MPSEVLIRRREARDLDSIVEMAARVMTQDRYPIYEPEEGLARFFSPDIQLAAWVAALEDRIVGHIALHSHATRPAMDIATEHEPSGHLAFVSRLITDPGMRSLGIGAALLDQT